VRTFPTGTGADCTTSTCGAGMLDANAALAAVTTAPTVNAGASQSMDSGKLAHLNGSASDDPHGSIVSWQWSQIDSSGYGVILSSTTTASTSFTVPAAPTGTVFTFRLTATDDTGLSGSATTNVTVGATIPVFTPVGDQSVSAGTTMRFTVTAADGDGTIPLLSASGLPAGASFSDNGDGTGAFVWPTPSGSNSSADVTFRATDRNDPSLYETMDVSVSGVVPASSGEGGGGGGGGAISPLALVTLLVAALRRRRAM